MLALWVIMAEVISCSRRTDVPAFKMNWLLECIRAQDVEVSNPRRTDRTRHVSLNPADVRAWVWWSKDYAPWIAAYQDANTGPLLRQYDAHVFNFTINGEAHSFLEPGLRTSLDERLAQLAWLAATFGPESVVLRFDPIVHYRTLGAQLSAAAGTSASATACGAIGTAATPIINNLEHFRKIASFAAACGVHFIVTAFAIPYPHIRARLRGRVELVDPPPAEKRAIITQLRDYVRELPGFQIRLCCMPTYGDIEEVGISSCINGEQINAALVRNGKAPISSRALKKDSGQRGECHCTKSTDIGGYGAIPSGPQGSIAPLGNPSFACEHACLYCYANPKKT